MLDYVKLWIHGNSGSDQVPVPMSAIFRLSMLSTGICLCESPPYSSFIIWCWWSSLSLVNSQIPLGLGRALLPHDRVIVSAQDIDILRVI